MLSEISEGRRFKPPSEIYRPGDLLPYTLRGITWKYALCFYDSDVYGTLLCYFCSATLLVWTYLSDYDVDSSTANESILASFQK
jgi:hypothetical protein